MGGQGVGGGQWESENMRLGLILIIFGNLGIPIDAGTCHVHTSPNYLIQIEKLFKFECSAMN